MLRNVEDALTYLIEATMASTRSWIGSGLPLWELECAISTATGSWPGLLTHSHHQV
jgi:hypothetical protein